MPSNLYVALSAQAALVRRLDSIAANVANAGTPGYRGDGVKFDSLVAQTGRGDVAFVSGGRDYVTTAPGPMTQTGNPLDVAIHGPAYFAIQTKNGIAYTRDGRMQMTETGALQSIAGNPVLDAGGSPIQLDSSAGPANVANDGMISQGGKQIGAIGLFDIDPAAALARSENSSVVPDIPAVPVLDFTRNGVAQGFVEGSNVDPVKEMTRLIAVQRAFESISSSMDASDRILQDAIKSLGAPS